MTDENSSAQPIRQSEILMVLRWTLGIFLLLSCGWGLEFLAYYLTESESIALPAASLVSFVLLYLLEKDLWLSRSIGLRVGPSSSRIKETVILWLFGGAAYLLLRSTQAEASQSPADRQQADGTP